jgi:peptidoglycan/xylan/chitin deacetylase (PgdA/CDA1 family)
MPDVVFFVPTTARLVALTLDDGPDGVVTPAVLDVLARHDASATFFLLGGRAVTLPGIVERISRENHELGNHTWEDRPAVCLTEAELHEDLIWTGEVLQHYGGTRLFRPGSGWLSSRVFRVAASLHYQCVLGSAYAFDAHIPYPSYVIPALLHRVRPGAILVLHEGEGRGYAPAILDGLLGQLTHRGYRAVSVSQLLSAASAD